MSKVMKKYIVFNTKELALTIAEYLSSLDIYKLFNVLFMGNKNCNTAISYIYGKLYSGMIDAYGMTFITNRIIKMGHTYKYIHQKNIQFSAEEICIRNILFEKFNIPTDEESDEDIDDESDEEGYGVGYADANEAAESYKAEADIYKKNKITSLYYLLYDNGYTALLNRFIVDGIVISPYECTHSNIRRKTIHYYGNEQTLRIALRYSKYDMIKQILSDIEYLSAKSKPNFSFIWNNNNILYESLAKSDIVGFQIMIDFAINHKRFKLLLLQISDEDVAYSSNNHFCSIFHETNAYHPAAADPYPNSGDDRIIQEDQKNALFNALFTDLANIKSWQHLGQLRNLGNFDESDFIITKEGVENNRPHFIFSKRFENYIDEQFNMLQEYCVQNMENLVFFNAINTAIINSAYNINFFDSYQKKNASGDSITTFLLFELLSIQYKNNKLFLMMFLITRKLHSGAKFDKNMPYNTKNNTVIINHKCQIVGLNGYAIIEYIKDIIYYQYNNGKIFNRYNDLDFACFINLILCYKLLI
jgi:hypothetical protein